MMGFRDRFDRSKRKKSTPRQRIGFAFFWLLVIAFAYFIPTGPNFNAESRLYLTFSIVDHHSLNIDPYHKMLGDEAYWKGHYYSDKAPGLSFMAVPVYAGLEAAFGRKGRGYFPHGKVYFAASSITIYLRYAITYLLVIMPSALFCVLLWLFLTQFLSTLWALLLAGAYGLGTTAHAYSMQFFGHQVCAILLFSAFLLIYWHARRRPLDGRALALIALAGLLAGYSVLSEYPTVVIAFALGVYLLAVSARRIPAAAAFLAGMVPPALLGLAYNLAVWGKPLAVGTVYVHSSMYQSHVKASGPLGLANPLGYGIQPPSLDSLWQITFGPYRGIFLICPVLLLFFAGLPFMARRKDLRPEFWLCLAVVVVYFLMDASRGIDQNGWSGGSSIASRHLVPVLPFMFLPIAFGLGNRLVRLAFLVLGTISVTLLTMITSTSDGYRVLDLNPLVNEMLPHVTHGRFLLSWSYFLDVHGFASLGLFLALEGLLVARLVWLFRVKLPEQEAAPVSRRELREPVAAT